MTPKPNDAQRQATEENNRHGAVRAITVESLKACTAPLRRMGRPAPNADSFETPLTEEDGPVVHLGTIFFYHRIINIQAIVS